MAFALKVNACAVLVGWALIALDATLHGQKQMPVLMIVVDHMHQDHMVNLGCACLISASVTLVLVVLGVMKSCRCGVQTIATIVVFAHMANAFVI